MKCPICTRNSNTLVYEGRNLPFTNIDKSLFRFKLKLCNSCSYVYQSSAYQKTYDVLIKKAYKNFNCNEVFSFPDRGPKNSLALQMIKKEIKGKININILEIGSNRGDLLYLLKEICPSANIIGVEPSLLNQTRVPTIHAFFNSKLFNNKFDLVIMKHVLEHIKNPKKIIADIKNILTKEGIIYLEMPNLNNSLNYCLDDFMPEHVSYFNKISLEKLMKGFRLINMDESNFLSTIFKKDLNNKPKTKNTFNGKLVYAKQFNWFKNKKINLIKKIGCLSRDNYKFVFYGISYYFKMIYDELESLLIKEKCSYYDDNFHECMEKTYLLPRREIEDVDGKTVIIICSNNFRVQEKIEAKLKTFSSNPIILRPWLRMTTKKEEINL